MAYPNRNTNGYTADSKNSSNFTLEGVKATSFLLIDSTYFLLIDSDNRLLIEPETLSWSYQSKS